MTDTGGYGPADDEPPLNDTEREDTDEGATSDPFAAIRRQIDASLGPALDRVRGQMAAMAMPAAQRFAERLAEQVTPQMQAFREHFAQVTVPKFVTPELRASFEKLREHVRDALPPNWPASARLEKVIGIITDEGLPLVYVPRSSLVEAVLIADGRDGRVGVLIAHLDEVVVDCRDALAEVTCRELSQRAPLATRAVDALADGHFEAAQALAVVVTEAAIHDMFGNYEHARRATKFDRQVALWQLRLRAAVAPIGSFYTPWWPSGGRPAPKALSRHVTVHHPVVDNYTLEHAVVAILLVASVLRALHDEYLARAAGVA